MICFSKKCANIFEMKTRSRKTTFKLTVSHYKILETIKSLNDRNLYPTAKGVNNILKGEIDDETILYKDISTYATLISFPGRKLCSYILNMVRREYITYIYDENSDGMYLKITEKGDMALFSYLRKHQYSHKKKQAVTHKEIVEIK